MYQRTIQLEQLQTNNGHVIVVRDDLLDGGTKQRAAVPFLMYFLQNGCKEFTYASPFSGFAQIGRAHV